MIFIEEDKENFGYHSPTKPKSNQNGKVLVFSPSKKLNEIAEPISTKNTNRGNIDNKTLICAKFQEPLWIEFGSVMVKSSNIQNFNLYNPSGKALNIVVDKISAKSGFTILLGNEKSSESVIIESKETVKCSLIWTPPENMSMREVIILKTDQRAPLQITAHGIAGTGKSEPNVISKKGNFKKTFKSLSSKNVSKLKKNNLQLSSRVNKRLDSKNGNPPKANSISRKNPTLSKKMEKHFPDSEKWAENQINSFTEWMNYHFNSTLSFNSALDANDDDLESTRMSITFDESIFQSAKKAASDLKNVLDEQEYSHLRQKASHLFRSESVYSVVSSIEEEVSTGRLTVREERDVLVDVGMQETLFTLLFSYEFSWLRLGLETIFSDNLLITSSKGQRVAKPEFTSKTLDNSKWKNSLKSFIFSHLINNEEIISNFSKQKPMPFSQEIKMKDQLRKNLLTKFLSLVLFLDNARTQFVLPIPSLFKKSATIKSSKEVIKQFCTSFLRGEGDIIKHLSQIGYTVKFEQAYVDEFDYSVTNLATDLRDGVRLTRLIEILTDSWEISKSLRVPAVSRLQKIHNVTIALDKIFDKKKDKAPDAKSIVDGNREITLMVLWRLMYNFELQMIISPEKVFNEIKEIQLNKNWKKSVCTSEEASMLAIKVPYFQEDGSIHYPVLENPEGIDFDNESTSEYNPALDDENTYYNEKSLSEALLSWCQSIVESYGVPVTDLTTCLSDGRALCLLVHYYHPNILPIALIRKTISNFMETKQEGESLTSFEFQKGIQNERKNFLILRKACQGIGGIPLVRLEYDSKNIPEEKAMVVFLGYLFTRLIESSNKVLSSVNANKEQNKNKKVDVNEKKTHIIKDSLQNVPVSIVLCPKKAAVLISSKIKTYLQRKAYISQIDLIKKGAQMKDPLESNEKSMAPSTDHLEESAKVDADKIDEENADFENFDDNYDTEDKRECSSKISKDSSSLLFKNTNKKILLNAQLQAELKWTLEKKYLEKKADEAKKAELEAFKAKMMKEFESERLKFDIITKQSDEEKQKFQSEVESEKRARELAEQRLKEIEAAQKLKFEEEMMKLEEEKKNQEMLQTIKKEEEIRLQLQREKEAKESQEQYQKMIEKERLEREEAEKKIQNEMEARKQLELKLQLLENEKKEREEKEKREKEELERLKLIKNSSALLIQAIWRMYEKRKKYSLVLRGTMRLQSRVRGSIVRKRALLKMLAIQIIQSLWRKKLCQKMLKELKISKAIVTIQSRFRSKTQRKLYWHKIESISKIQSMIRMKLQRRKFRNMINKVIKIQFIMRKCLKEIREREKLSETMMEIFFEEKRVWHATDVIGSFMLKVVFNLRRNKAATKIQKWNRIKLLTVRIHKLVKGFTRLVAYRKALKIRKSNSVKVNALLRRIKDSDKKARSDPSLRLGKQTISALHVLQNGKMISQLLKSCQTLELSTQLSRYCCEAFAGSEAPEILFNLLRSCNRSTPHQELLRIALVVLLNVARHHHLAPILAEAPDSTDTLLDLIQMFRDKKPVFVLSTELLSRLVNASAETKEICNSPIYRKRLEGIQNIIERKNRLEQRIKSIGSSNSNCPKYPTVSANSTHGAKSQQTNGFDIYSGKAYEQIEPITCMQHLMGLLNKDLFK